MSSFRPNELAAMKADREQRPGPVTGRIETDRTCRGCGYELRGLPIGGNCPECGLSTLIPETIDDPLSLMPVDVIRRFKWGCWSAFWILLLNLVLGIVHSWDRLPAAMTLSALLAVSISWQAAARLVTPALGVPQGVLRGFSRRGKLRFAVQWMQLGWVVAMAAQLLALVVKAPASRVELLSHISRGGMLTGFLGLVLLALLLERLAEWARDSESQRIFNWIIWGLPVAALLLLWTPPNALLSLALHSIALVTILLYPIAVLMLARSVSLSVYHAIEHELRRERQQERRDQFFEKVVDTYLDASSAGDESRGEDPSLERIE